MALTHPGVWSALETIAKNAGLSTSGLAKAAGLDPTSFNRSKRASPEGRPRWPSTESVAKVLDATGTTFSDFARLADTSQKPRGVPMIAMAQAGAEGHFDELGFPIGPGWNELVLPGVEQAGVYALEISGDSMAPLYRDGDRIIVGADVAPRRGDRVLLKTSAGEVMAKELARMTAKVIEFRSIEPDHPGRTLDRKDVAWMARILWASQ